MDAATSDRDRKFFGSSGGGGGGRFRETAGNAVEAREAVGDGGTGGRLCMWDEEGEKAI